MSEKKPVSSGHMSVGRIAYIVAMPRSNDALPDLGKAMGGYIENKDIDTTYVFEDIKDARAWRDVLREQAKTYNNVTIYKVLVSTMEEMS
jgi:hypothetical protein